MSQCENALEASSGVNTAVLTPTAVVGPPHEVAAAVDTATGAPSWTLWATVTGVAHASLLSFLCTRDLVLLRAVDVAARAAVAQVRWKDHAVVITRHLEGWRASFPRAIVLRVMCSTPLASRPLWRQAMSWAARLLAGSSDDPRPTLAHVIAMMPALAQLTTLAVYNNSSSTGCDDARGLGSALKSTPLLVSLDVSNHTFDADGARALAHGLSAVPCLEELCLQANSLGVDGARAVAGGLAHLPHLQVLNVSRNSIGADGARALADALHHMPLLLQLNLSENELGAQGARALAGALQHVPQLVGLYAWSNSLGPEGALALAAALRHVPHLQFLEVSGNGIRDAGARALAHELPNVPELRILHVGYNLLREGSVRALRAALPPTAKLIYYG
jgi:hypothetical protein